MKKKRMRIIAWALSACLLLNIGIEQNSILAVAAEVETPSTTPSQAPGETEVIPTPETVVPSETPGTVEPSETPGSIVPSATPENSTPSEAPGSSEPSETPETVEPSETPEIAVPSESTESISPTPTASPEATPSPMSKGNLRAGEAANYLTIDPEELKTTYVLSYPEDFIILQEYLDEKYDERFNGFAGITFQISTPPDGDGIWKLNELEGFTGIGTAAHPFQGTLECAINEGVSFQFNKPLFASLGDGAEVRKISISCQEGCSAVIAEDIAAGAKVSIHDITVNGTIQNAGGNAGLIAASVGEGAEITLGAVTGNVPVPVSGQRAGLLCGTIGAGASFAISDGAAIAVGATVTGTDAAGGLFGEITGDIKVNLDMMSQITGDLSVQSSSETGYAGGLAGKLTSGSLEINSSAETISFGIPVAGSGTSGGLLGYAGSGTSVQVSAPVQMTGNISGVNAGGVFGEAQGSSYVVDDNGDTAISGTISASQGSAGGFAGLLGGSMELKNVSVTSESILGKNTGGITGSLKENARVLFHTMTVNPGTLQGSLATGGVVGAVETGVALELAGDITIAKDPSGSGKGSIAGVQNEALVYLREIGETGNSQLKLPAGSLVDEIGNYGGVFRNQATGSGKLIGDGTLANVGTVNQTVSGDVSGGFVLASASDFECLAIVLNTQGQFGRNAFGNAEVEALLGATYTVTNAVNLSYTQTGIVTLNRNDSENAQYAFRGSLQGTGSSGVAITKNIANRQSRLGLFSTLDGEGVYKNLILDGEITLTPSAGGLAYQTIGTGLELENFTTHVKLSNVETCGGVLAMENSNSAFRLTGKNLLLAAEIDAQAHGNYSGFITDMSNATVELEQISLGGSLFSTLSGQAVGGFLGKKWDATAGTISKVTVAEQTTYSAQGVFGILLGTVNNQSGGSRLTLEDVKLSGLTVNASAESSHCSLLIQDATELVLEVIDYDATGCTVNNPGSQFDEIAGKTFADNSRVSTGIVSLHKTNTSFPSYHYENGATGTNTQSNSDTMYFYDLFQKFEGEDGSVLQTSQITGNEIDNIEKLLLWDVVHYAAAGKVRDTFKKYYAESTIPNFTEETITLSGTLAVSDISFYPVPNLNGITVNGTGATVTFGSKTEGGTSMREWSLPNHLSSSQHFRLQSGLLWYPEGTATVTGLTLAGTCTCLETYNGILASGALINGTVAGGSFQNITVKNLFLDGYTDDGSGLLIGRIPTGSAEFESIKMTGYSAVSSDPKAAAALIGSAGSNVENNLTLSFRKMKIADEVDGKHLYNGDVLKYASLLYSYTYTDDASTNKGSGLYLFTEEEALTDKTVTYGSELDSTTEFEDTSHRVLEKLDIADTAGNHFKPYVYQSKQIEVNPKTGDILEGCGTYEDPYIIENVQQFLTLYRFMNETGNTAGEYQYKSFYTGWQVNAPGDDATFCDGEEASHVIKTFTADANTDFPTPLQMSRAYYELGADIDLSGITSGTYSIIASDFVGFGTEERPFTGVWYGGADKHTVTLPTKLKTQTFSTYGFIQYAQGAVVKDLNIVLPDRNSNEATVVNDVFGGVIANIKGGDNIIDQVAVSGPVRLNAEVTVAGGYAGVIEKGSLILRNVTGDLILGFQLQDAVGRNLTSEDATNYFQIGALIGRVEDGYVVYEGSSAETPIWQEITTGGAGGIVLCKNYDILNGAYLDGQTQAEKITISSGDATNGGNAYTKLIVSLPNAAALQVFSMALNSDSLSVSSSGANYAGGYTELSRCRKGQYSNIGSCTAETEDYQKVKTYDNCMNGGAEYAYAYPYVYRYFGITDYESYIDGKTTTGGVPACYSVWNPYGLIGGKLYRTNWELESNETYDLSVFEDSFRGIGAIYHQGTDMKGSLFRGDFDGKNSTITYRIERKAMVEDEQSVKIIGLFNTMNVNYAAILKAGNIVIQNIALDGSIAVAEGYESAYAAGGIVGRIYGGTLEISNITVNAGFSIDNQKALKKINNSGQIGAMVGMSGGSATLTLSKCILNGTAEKPILLRGKDSGGGLVGEQGASGGILTIENCQVNYLDLNVYKPRSSDTVWSTGGNAGGLVGYSNTGSKLTITNSSCNNSTITGYWQAGGLVGETRINTVITGEVGSNSEIIAAVDGTTVQAYKHVGGIIGECYDTQSTSRSSKLENILVQNITLKETTSGNETNGLGGVIGQNAHTLTITNLSVRGTESDSCSIQANTKNRVNRAGGVIGLNADSLLLSNCTIDQVSVTTSMTATALNNVAAGGVIGYTSAGVTLDGTMKISDVTIKAPTKGSNITQIVAAGGLAGHVDTAGSIKSNNAQDIYYSGLTISNPVIIGTQAGGAFGYLAGKVYLEGVSISGTGSITAGSHTGSITGDRSAGGFAGTILSSAVELNDVTDQTANTVKDLIISARNAGGFAGELTSTGDIRLNGIQVSGCSMTGKSTENLETCVGGIIGAADTGAANTLKVYNAFASNNLIAAVVEDGTTLTGVNDCYSVGGALGKNLQSSAGTIFWDALQLSENVTGIYANAGEVKLVNKDGALVSFPDMATIDYIGKTYYAATGKAAGENGLYIGNFVGTECSTASQMYFLNSTVSYAEGTTNIPVTDVGRTKTQAYGSYRTNCHILYNHGLADLTDGTATTAYMAERVGQAKGTIPIQPDLNVYAQSYRLSEETVEIFDKTYQKEYEYESESGKTMPMFVYKPENGTVQQVVDALTEVMTNAAGAPASTMEILEVTSKRKLLNTATNEVTDGEVGDCSILAQKSENVWNYTYQNYDEVEDGTMSYTELTFTYGWKDNSSDSTSHTQTYVLPIFTEEIITMGIYGNMKEGKILSVEDMKTTGVTGSVMMANDSDYTLFFEYVYGNARKNQEDTVTVDKVFYLTQNNVAGEMEAKKLAAGTKLTLIDVTHGNKPYYYTVTEETPEKISYTEFTDSAGNKYENQPIYRLEDEGTQSGEDVLYADMNNVLLKNVGVERYLIFVEKPTTYDDSTALYRICTNEHVEDDTVLNAKLLISNTLNLQITAVPGMTISFLDESMDITGNIKKDDTVIENITFQMRGSELYWALKSVGGSAIIDSENHDKFLELGLYLRDSKGNRVYFPSGTNFRYRIGAAEMSEYQAISDVSILYFYKEISSEYKIEDITADTTVAVTVEFSFGNANLTELTDTTYQAHIDLLRTANKDYPMGSNNKLDTYSHELTANPVQELGFAVMPDNYLDLGINTYMNSETEHRIPFSVKFDFSDILNNVTASERDDAIQKWAGYRYQVVYSFEEKTAGGEAGANYISYSGDALSLLTVSAGDSGEEGSTVESPVNGPCVYTISEDEIENGIASRSMLLKVASQELDLSNYRVRATLTVMEQDSVPGTSLTDDFFVFTITKLKTD